MLCYYALLGLEIGLLLSSCAAVLLCCVRVIYRVVAFFLSSRAVLCCDVVLGLEIGLLLSFFPPVLCCAIMLC